MSGKRMFPKKSGLKITTLGGSEAEIIEQFTQKPRVLEAMPDPISPFGQLNSALPNSFLAGSKFAEEVGKISYQGLVHSLVESKSPTLARSDFRLSNAAIFYGTITVDGSVTSETVRAWNIDTLITSNRRSYNGDAADTRWEPGALAGLRSSAEQDVFAYVNVGKVAKALDTYVNASASDPWFGGVTTTLEKGEVKVVNGVNYANFWEPSWFEKLKTEVDEAIKIGADGLFLDDVGVCYELGLKADRVGDYTKRMMQLVIDLSAYARQSSKGGSNLRIFVNGMPFMISNSIFGKGGGPDNQSVGNLFVNAIDAMLFENPFLGNTNEDGRVNGLDVAALKKMRDDFYSLGKQIVIVDSMKLEGAIDYPNGQRELARTAAEYGFIPLYSKAGSGGGGQLDFLTPPILSGPASNRASVGDDWLIGTPIAEFIDARSGNDSISGWGGNDTLVGGVGADVLNGGDGFDFASYEGSEIGVSVFMNGGTASSGEATNDTHFSIEGLIGSRFGDVLSGDVQANLLQGYNGNDVLLGVAGADTLQGGDGNDTLSGGIGADFLDGGNGFDFASYEGSEIGISVFMNGGTASSGEATNDTHFSIEALIGSRFGDILGGDAQANLLQGYNGNDFLLGVTGADTLQGGDGNDALSGGMGADFLDGGNGIDVAYYRDAKVSVTASLVSGGTGGEANGDTYFGIENIWGSVHGDNLTGDNDAGQVYGFEGNDALSGLAGDDFFYGGSGADTLTGGVGVDSFFVLAWRDQVNRFGTVERSEGGDSFTDFTSGTDRIIVSRYWFGFGNLGGPAAALTEANANFVTDSSAATNRVTFLWNSQNRTLSFDADGMGNNASVLLATFQQGASLVLSDIWTA